MALGRAIDTERHDSRMTYEQLLKGPHTMARMLEYYGSFRRILNQYWTGELIAEQEKAVENDWLIETIAAFKPVFCDRMHVSDLPPMPDPPMPDPFERKLMRIEPATIDKIGLMLREGWFTDSFKWKPGDTIEFKRPKPFEVRK